MEMTKQFSIVIPTYNYGHFIEGALKSVLQQSGDDYEIIVIDDGSSDNTEQVIKHYLEQHPTIIQYYYQDNQGTAAARNMGIERTQGNYVIFLDADDQLMPNIFTEIRRYIVAHPEIDMFIGGYKTLFPNQKEKVKSSVLLANDNLTNFISHLRQKFSIPNGSAIIKRHVFKSLKFNAGLPTMFDEIFYNHVLALFHCLSIPLCIVQIFRHSDSLRHNYSYVMSVADKIVNFLFDPTILPQSFMIYRQEFISRCQLTLFRSCYLEKNFQLAKHYYYRAIRAYPKNLFLWSYLRKYLKIQLIYDQ